MLLIALFNKLGRKSPIEACWFTGPAGFCRHEDTSVCDFVSELVGIGAAFATGDGIFNGACRAFQEVLAHILWQALRGRKTARGKTEKDLGTGPAYNDGSGLV